MKKSYITLLGIGIAVCLPSCGEDYLEKLPQGNYVEGTYYVSDKALEAATSVLYNRPWFEYNSEGALYISSMANECFDAWNAPEFNTMQVTALNPHLSNIWRSFFRCGDHVKLHHRCLPDESWRRLHRGRYPHGYRRSAADESRSLFLCGEVLGTYDSV